MSASEILRLALAAADGHRLSIDEARLLFERGSLLHLGEAADRMRFRLHPSNLVTYVVDRNINYTNVCISQCRFCAFWRDRDAGDAYLLSYEDIAAKVRELVAAGGTQVLMQGGLNPEVSLEWVEGILRRLRTEFPGVDLHCLSPPEVVHLAHVSGLGFYEALVRLRQAGLSSLPGGGAEILSNRVRSVVSPRKCTASQWVEVMEAAHAAGLRATATMMFGHAETLADRAQHLLRLRGLQDRTGVFTAFIPWTFQPANTALASLSPAGAHDYLRTLAVSRLVLDNVPNIQASWVTQGAKIAQLALRFGANDLGGTMMEENVVAAAGCRFAMSGDELRALAREAGFELRQRRTDYRLVV